MRERLRNLHALVSCSPVLARNHGAIVAVSGDHVVQFAKDEDALFFVQAYMYLPAILAELDEKDIRLAALNTGALSVALDRIVALESALAAARTRQTELEQTVVRAGAARARAEQRAKAALHAASQLQRQIDKGA